jgi:hypothetical protein
MISANNQYNMMDILQYIKRSWRKKAAIMSANKNNVFLGVEYEEKRARTTIHNPRAAGACGSDTYWKRLDPRSNLT